MRARRLAKSNTFGKHDLHAGRPVRAIETEAGDAAVELPVRIRAAAAREDARLEDRRAADRSATARPPARGRRRRRPGATCASGCVVAAGGASRSAGGIARAGVVASIVTGPARDAQHARERRSAPASRACRAWISARLRGGALGVGARRLGARPQLIVDERVGGAREHARGDRRRPARRRRPAARRRRPETPRRRASARRDASAPRRRARARRAASALGDRRLAQTEVERLPREQRARRAAPDAAGRRRRQHRARTSRESPTAAAPGRRCCWPCRDSTARANRVAADRPTCATLTPAVDAFTCSSAARTVG